eukprot:gb/GECG01012704.1/.p1 GENE.gb/GECG01012704.1/~~gb/GECG01012704.1/.p1  ORF type:complete len:842 (+),score=73.46 gb/GECG01012704.1/:1-2526(+)
MSMSSSHEAISSSTHSCPQDVQFHPSDLQLFTFLSYTDRTERICDLYAGRIHDDKDIETYPLVRFKQDLEPRLPVPRESKHLSLEEQLRQERTRSRTEGIHTYVWSPCASKTQPYLLIPHGANLFLSDSFSPGSKPKLIVSEEHFKSRSGILNPTPSPDGKMVAFVSDGEIYLFPVTDVFDSCTLPLQPVQLTQGTPETSRGMPDFLAQEELERLVGFWWSLDSQWISFQENDELDVRDMNIVRYGDESTDNVERHKYPFSGSKNPKVSIGILDVARSLSDRRDGHEAGYVYQRRVQWLRIPSVLDFYLVNAFWCPDNSFLVQTMPRSQQQVDILRFALDGKNTVELLLREYAAESHWINVSQDAQLLCNEEGGDTSRCYLLWLSERTGYRHLFCHHINLRQFSEASEDVLWDNYTKSDSGQPCQPPKRHPIPDSSISKCEQLTDGIFTVQRVIKASVARNQVVFGANVSSPLDFGVFAVPLFPEQRSNCNHFGIISSVQLNASLSYSGDDILSWGTRKCVYPVFARAGAHNAVLNCNCSVALSRYSSRSDSLQWNAYVFQDSSCIHCGLLWEKPPPSKGSSDARVDFFSCLAADETSTLFGCVWNPQSPISAAKGSRTVVTVYGGPHVQRIQNSHVLLERQSAISRLIESGFTVVAVDNRGSANRGVAFESVLRNRLGKVEVDDQVAALKHLSLLGAVNMTRVGIYGWSYGGYMALMCLMTAPSIFKSAVSGAPVTDWKYYDTCYTERYIRTPQENPEGYTLSDVKHYVENMKGDLLLVHGLIDENVYFQHTGSLLQALVSHRKRHRLVALPNSRHGPRTPQESWFIEDAIVDHFTTTLV